MDITGYAFVAGGGSGIGRACCIAFARDGAAGVLVTDLNLDAAQAVASECKAAATNPIFRTEAIHANVTVEQSVRGATVHAVQSFGRVDYCVNCAGVGVQYAREVADVDVKEFDRFMAVNVIGTLLVTSIASAIMRSQEPFAVISTCGGRGVTRGTIVNLGSAASYIASPQIVQYTASKYAVLGITKNAALDNVKHGIRVNCVCPTWVDTLMVQRALESIEELGSFIEGAVLMGRLATPEEISDTVIFLCSPRSSYITGIGFIVDGGTTLTAHV
ncbi:NAD(P)-binding protein [Xylariomycetidae sp. FL2044]|nr:NAD(P)-binding protein [Xylariomycetidae sp. FL2044]